MTSKRGGNMRDLTNILNELSKYGQDRNKLKALYIQDRLEKSLLLYEKELKESCIYLAARDQLKVMRKFNRL